MKKRDECALLALQDLLGYLKTEGDVRENRKIEIMREKK